MTQYVYSISLKEAQNKLRELHDFLETEAKLRGEVIL
jgi:hypothetical protein